jgi:hypothetical protein
MPFALADGEGKGLNYICFEVLRRIRAKVEYQYVASRLIRDEEAFAPLPTAGRQGGATDTELLPID